MVQASYLHPIDSRICCVPPHQGGVPERCSPPGATGADRTLLIDELVGAGIPAVIGMQFPVEDSHAIAFSQGLYSALAARLSDKAVSLGRRRMHELGILINWGAPVVFSRSPDGRLFGLPDAEGIDQTARIIAYQAGRAIPPEGPVEPGMRAAIGDFCDNGIRPRSAMSGLKSTPSRSLRPMPMNSTTGLRTSFDYSPPRIRSRWPRKSSAGGLALSAARIRLLRRARNQLATRQRGSLSRFSVQDSAGKYWLKRLPVADLLDRSPDAHAVELSAPARTQPLRRWALWRGGCAYGHHVRLAVHEAGDAYRPGARALFYYLSKALLKLNWYDELHDVLEGPYWALSQSLLKDLEAERWQVAGIRFASWVT